MARGRAGPSRARAQRTARAEQITGRKQGDDQEPAIVDPHQDRREIGGGDLLAEQPVQHDDDRRRQQYQLK